MRREFVFGLIIIGAVVVSILLTGCEESSNPAPDYKDRDKNRDR